MEPGDLYGLPLDRFIAERTALAKALRADRRRDDEGAVAAMRKPSVAAWAVNQLVRGQGRAIEELFDAGDALREAQAQLLAGRGDGGTLRAANERERSAVDNLVEAACGLLSSEGQEPSATVVDRVADTLHAAALDEDAREQVREGVLERELRHVGLGLGESAAPAAPTREPAKRTAPEKAAKQAATKKPTKRATPKTAAAKTASKKPAERADPKRVERERAAARKAARTAEASARRRAERASHALRAAEERRERAAQALNEADEALATARKEAKAATAAQQRAKADLKNNS